MTEAWGYFALGLLLLALGLLLAARARLPRWAGLGLTGGFALLHGLAHGAEMPASASLLAYGAGFMAVSAALHLAGLALYVPLHRISRAIGALLAVAGVGLLLGMA